MVQNTDGNTRTGGRDRWSRLARQRAILWVPLLGAAVGIGGLGLIEGDGSPPAAISTDDLAASSHRDTGSCLQQEPECRPAPSPQQPAVVSVEPGHFHPAEEPRLIRPLGREEEPRLLPPPPSIVRSPRAMAIAVEYPETGVDEVPPAAWQQPVDRSDDTPWLSWGPVVRKNMGGFSYEQEKTDHRTGSWFPNAPRQLPADETPPAELPVDTESPPLATETPAAEPGALESEPAADGREAPELADDPPRQVLRGAPLPCPQAAPPRSRHLEIAARGADVHTRRGFDLAGRGAHFSARAEFIAALRLLARALDAERQCQRHGEMLSAGLRALKEAADFVPQGDRVEADLDLESIVETHHTPALLRVPLEQLAPAAARERYLTFAQEQLAVSVDGEFAGSMALYGLGKLYGVLSRQPAPGIVAAGSTAVVFHQAALLISPKNYMAANDLGVLLAQAGRYEDARIALEHSASIGSQAVTWQNLAGVCSQLGEQAAAGQARRQAQCAFQTLAARGAASPRSDGPRVQWLAPGEFARLPVSSPDNTFGDARPMSAPTADSGPRAREFADDDHSADDVRTATTALRTGP
ncbi:MAG: hypothetical protein HQ581_17590 [Planctomycetes bacterium]|nr:hypothetical protein [Planctomycetota bacterium]